MKKLLGCFLCVMLLVFGSWGSAFAIPNLGVAPAPSEYGYYMGSMGNNVYLSFFADEFLNIPGGDGFYAPDSGGSLAVWYTGDPNVDVTLATNAALGDDFTFDGMDFTSFTTEGGIDGYAPQYVDGDDDVFTWFGVNIGPVYQGDGTTLNAGWIEIEDGAWDAGGPFYYYVGTITFPELGPDDWLFALADKDSDGEFGGGEFSPKTTSSVPEPATMFLLGAGLIVLGGISRKKFVK